MHELGVKALGSARDSLIGLGVNAEEVRRIAISSDVMRMARELGICFGD